jgi:hypothetical protein
MHYEYTYMVLDLVIWFPFFHLQFPSLNVGPYFRDVVKYKSYVRNVT